MSGLVPSVVLVLAMLDGWLVGWMVCWEWFAEEMLCSLARFVLNDFVEFFPPSFSLFFFFLFLLIPIIPSGSCSVFSAAVLISHFCLACLERALPGMLLVCQLGFYDQSESSIGEISLYGDFP